MAKRVRIGTSGWNYKHWRGRFYPNGLPQKKWLEEYARVFDTVEINNSFYRQPQDATFDAWRNQAPKGFLYAVKANRYITHLKRLKDPEDPLRRFLKGARRLRGNLGPLLYQLPPRWNPDLERLEAFLKRLPGELQHAVEFRDAKWLTEETFRLLERFRVALCVHDMLPRHPRRVTAPLVYVRFHGSGRKYGGKYGKNRLTPWAEWIGEVSRRYDVFVYFNNDIDAAAIDDAMALKNLVGQ